MMGTQTHPSAMSTIDGSAMNWSERATERSPPESTTLSTAFGAALACSAAVSVLGNLATVLAYAGDRRLRDRPAASRLVLALSCSDLAVGLLTTAPTAGSLLLGPPWRLGETGCRVLVTAGSLFVPLAPLLVSAICLDRYLLVSRDYSRYLALQTDRTVGLTIAVCLTLTSVLCISQNILWQSSPTRELIDFSRTCVAPTDFILAFSLYTNTVYVLVPFAVVLGGSVRFLVLLRRRLRAHGKVTPTTVCGRPPPPGRPRESNGPRQTGRPPEAGCPTGSTPSPWSGHLLESGIPLESRLESTRHLKLDRLPESGNHLGVGRPQESGNHLGVGRPLESCGLTEAAAPSSVTAGERTVARTTVRCGLQPDDALSRARTPARAFCLSPRSAAPERASQVLGSRYVRPTVTVVCLVLALAVCYLPYCLYFLTVAVFLAEPDRLRSPTFHALHLLRLFNSSLDPVLYAATQRRVRAFYGRHLRRLSRLARTTCPRRLPRS